jgi:hypothetical protein
MPSHETACTHEKPAAAEIWPPHPWRWIFARYKITSYLKD